METVPPTPAVAVTRPIKKNIEAFAAIITFVNDLWDVFGKNNSANPLALYHRLIGRINMSDTEGIQKAVYGFSEFLKVHEPNLANNQLDKIPRGTVIKYGTSDKIHLEIQKFIYQSDSATKEAIVRHLLTISTILEPNKEKLAQLEKRIADLSIDTSTKEGKFVSNLMERAKTSMTSVNTEDPMQAMMSIFQSGIIQEMVVGLQQGVGSGEMNTQALLGVMQSAIGSILPQTQMSQIQASKPNVEEIHEKK